MHGIIITKTHLKKIFKRTVEEKPCTKMKCCLEIWLSELMKKQHFVLLMLESLHISNCSRGSFSLWYSVAVVFLNITSSKNCKSLNARGYKKEQFLVFFWFSVSLVVISLFVLACILGIIQFGFFGTVKRSSLLLIHYWFWNLGMQEGIKGNRC